MSQQQIRPAFKAPQQPEVRLPSAPKAREAVKSVLEEVMRLPGIGKFTRALAAEQEIFPNFKVDNLTYYTLKRLLSPTSCCIDVGAHNGAVTSMMLEFAPQGRHFAFEPLAECVFNLHSRFAGNKNVSVCPVAVGERAGQQDFVAVRGFPGFSGFAQRHFTGGFPDLETRSVTTHTLDESIPPDVKIDLIKLDIEGAELPALRGAERILRESQPTLLLEFQRSAASYFHYTPDDMLSFLRSHNYQTWSLESWLLERKPLTTSQLWDLYEGNPNLYLLCRPNGAK
jgi:FkbM family methyltransferase